MYHIIDYKNILRPLTNMPTALKIPASSRLLRMDFKLTYLSYLLIFNMILFQYKSKLCRS